MMDQVKSQRQKALEKKRFLTLLGGSLERETVRSEKHLWLFFSHKEMPALGLTPERKMERRKLKHALVIFLKSLKHTNPKACLTLFSIWMSQ